VIRGFPWALVLFVLAALHALFIVVGVAFSHEFPICAIVITGVALIAAVAGGVFVQGAGLFARPLLRVDGARARDRVALTFDDGPDPVHTRRVADLLEARGHRGTFFAIGQRAEEHASLLAELVQRGHALGNHSFSHAHTTPFFPVDRLAGELERVQALFERAAGVRPRWFRPPVGILSPRVVQAARRAGLELVGWSASARDGVRTTVDDAYARLARGLKPGAILVLHDGSERAGATPIAPEVLTRVLDEMARRGLRSVTLDDLTGGQA
jgi:peptidoglycan/xylan/chitin deacetylase (PgdA/CDA1 family)